MTSQHGRVKTWTSLNMTPTNRHTGITGIISTKCDIPEVEISLNLCFCSLYVIFFQRTDGRGRGKTWKKAEEGS